MYKSELDLLETEKAIKLVKDTFERKLAEHLHLTRVSAPLFVYSESGLNDDLSGKERPVVFDALSLDKNVEIIHSLAKWKRMALKNYGIERFNGIYTDMNAIRRDETLDNLHSLYVDQWDWEKVIANQDRTIDFLKGTVERIMKALYETESELLKKFPVLPKTLSDNAVYFIDSEELLKMYPNMNGKQRENLITEKYKNVFIIGIGDKLSNGLPHDSRAPDYDDWHLNGDLLVWSEQLHCAVELSSMGIRVNKESLLRQLEISNTLERKNYPFHQALLNDQLPLTMGGGIGQSRLCMVLLNKVHIGQVQASLWGKDIIEKCQKEGIELL